MRFFQFGYRCFNRALFVSRYFISVFLYLFFSLEDQAIGSIQLIDLLTFCLIRSFIRLRFILHLFYFFLA